MLDGARTIRIHGMDVPVNAHVEVVSSMSAHADSKEMLHWLRGFKHAPKRTFLVHGEPVAMEALHASITTELKWTVHMPQWKEKADLQ
jgi:metallo-beta-lactamase family protein